MRAWVIFLIFSVNPLFVSAASVITNDGAWCWFTEPRAITWEGKTYTGWVSKEGDIVVAAIDSASHAVDTVILHARFQYDDHDNPSFLMWPDGRLYCFYALHNGSRMYLRVMQIPGNLHSMGPETYVGPPAGVNLYTYPCPIMLPGEDSALYVFCRGGGDYWNPYFTVSRDRGVTWDALRHFIISPGQRPYFKFSVNGVDRFDVIFTDGHPSAAYNNVYYAYYRAGALYKADGTYIKSMDSLPLTLSEAEKIYDANANHAKAWVWDLALDGAGHPVVAYVNFPTDADHRYRFARWDGAHWLDQELCKGGKWFPETVSGQTEQEPNYSGGIALDHNNPFNLYLARPDSVSGVFGIEQWRSTDSGAHWQSRVVIGGVDTLNVRPVVPRGAPAGVKMLYMSGKYPHFTSYNTSIRMVSEIDSTLPSSPSDLHVETSQKGAVMLSWNAASDGETGILGYEIYRGPYRDNLSRVRVVHGLLFTSDTFIGGTDTLYYAVKALNGNGLRSEDASDTVSAVLLPYTSAVLHSSKDTLASWASAEIKIYGVCGDGTIDSGNIGAQFFSLDTALLFVTSSGHVVAKSVPGIACVVAKRGGVWLGDTCFINIIESENPFLYRFDFRCTDAVTDTHWIPQNGSAYDSFKGYGWMGCAALPENRCDRAGGDLLGTFVMVRSSVCTTGVFRVDAPDGDYLVRIGLGDASYPTEPLWVMYGSDTIARYTNPGNLGNGYSVCDDTITVSGNTGASFTVRGTPNAKISYLILLSSQGIAMNDVAYDGMDVTGIVDVGANNGSLQQLTATPNPFNPTVAIHFSLPVAQSAILDVFDVRGGLVAHLLDGQKDAGEHKVVWAGTRQASGVYLLRLQAGTKVLEQKLVYLK